MVSIRLTSFLLVFFLLHVIIRAHSHQTMHKIEARRILGAVDKEIKVGVPSAAEVMKNKSLRGRKVTLKKDLMRKDGDKNGNLNQDQVVEVSGACNSKTVRCNRRSNKGIYLPKIDVLAAFSADYYVPRSHPPKNN